MNRTRSIFFLILAAYLGVIATTLVLKIVNAPFLRGLFIASTIFSVGVVLFDFLGVLGEHQHGDAAGDVTAGHLGGDHSGDFGGAHSHADTGHPGDHPAADLGHNGETHASPHQVNADADPVGADLSPPVRLLLPGLRPGRLGWRWRPAAARWSAC